MKRLKFYTSLAKRVALAISLSMTLFSCEKGLEQEVFTRISPDEFPKNADDVKAFVTSSYGGIGRFYATTVTEAVLPASFMSGHLVPGTLMSNETWRRMTVLDLDADMSNLFTPYLTVMPKITMIAIKIDQISKVADINEDLKARYLAELYGLRAFYTQQLYNLYGPVPIRTDPEQAIDPTAAPIPRPSNEEMVKQIESDYLKAIPALPARYSSSSDYGRFTSTVCYTGLMNLYMHEKNWEKAIEMGNIIQTLGYSLVDDYNDNFGLEAIGGNSEIILAIPTQLVADPSTRLNPNTNSWQIVALTPNYRGSLDPDIAENPSLDRWGWFAMPWNMYDKFDPEDKRTKRLFGKWIGVDGEVFDARAEGYVGAIPLKYAIDPQSTGESNRINIVCWRYADVLLLQAEAINEVSGPTSEAYALVNTIRRRAGLDDLESGLNKDQFRNAIMDERFFELWAEGTARNDMIRWGTFIQRAIDLGSEFVKEEYVLYPLPRDVVNESGGVVKQNPEYY